jgi:GABA(A) receptor-associated protein
MQENPRQYQYGQFKDAYTYSCPKTNDTYKIITSGIIDKNKFLVPSDLSIAQFLFTIRKRIKLRPEQSLFLFVKNSIPRSDILLSQLYKEYKDEDGFLYITYSGENTFG